MPALSKSALSKRTFDRLLLASLFTGAILLSGCGIKGSLDTPPPLWGDEKPESEQRAEDSILNESPLDDEPDDIFSDPQDSDPFGENDPN
jgi:predicted small lipoprotein YifL